MVPENTTHLETTYMGGGSFATLPPVFKEDGTTIYNAWRDKINGYNCKTGRKVQEFSGLNEDIVGFGTIYKNGDECLVACTKSGKFCVWRVDDCTKLEEKQLPCEIKSFRPILDKTSTKSKAIIVFRKPEENQETVKIKYTIIGVVNLHKTTIYIIPIEIEKKVYFDVGEIEGGDKYLVLAQGRYLCYIDLEKRKKGTFPIRRHMLASPKFYTAVTTPRLPSLTPDCIAGDNQGRITLYTNLTLNRPPHSVLHWHTLPVLALSMSAGDTRLYSGGGEGVLVLWALQGPEFGNKLDFVPRLGGELRWIGVGGGEGGKRMVGAYVHGEGVWLREEGADWEGMWLRRMLSTDSSSDVGLVYDNRSKCIILNGNMGCIQFYSISAGLLLYSMDVVRHNKLTHERNKTVVNIRVKHVAVNENGVWYATIEERFDIDAIYELRLKFWKFEAETQMFHLNTSIEYPHEKNIVGLEFRPNRTGGHKLDQCITISKDGLFKIWHLVEIMGVDAALSLTWRCATTAYYKPPFKPACLSFSQDGSVLALGYGPAITIWLPDTCQLKRTLTYDNSLAGIPKSPEDIKSVAFGRGRCNYLVVGITKKHLTVWNLLTYALTLRIKMDIIDLIPDPSSCVMAILKKNNIVYFFEPDQSDPIKEFKIPDEHSIQCCTFVPQECTKGSFENKNSKIKSQFFYLNAKHEMYCLGAKLKTSDYAKDSLNIESSNFSRLLAEKLITTVKKQENRRIIHENPNNKNELKRLLYTPNHTQIPLSLLACSFLHSLVLNETAPADTQQMENSSNKIVEYGPVAGETNGKRTGLAHHPGTLLNLNKMKIKDKDWVKIL